MVCVRKTCFLIVVKLIFLIIPCIGQNKISCPEKWWAVFHPFAAKKIYDAAKIALEGVRKVKTDSLLDNRNSGGTLDAFRHAYWMALASQKVKAKKAISFGKAHERGNFKMFKKLQYEEGEVPDSVSGTMDLFNNAVGAKLGCENKLMSQDSLFSLVVSKIKAGEMKIVAMDCLGNYVDCNFKTIEIEKLHGRWINNKCLVPSNTSCFKK